MFREGLRKSSQKNEKYSTVDYCTVQYCTPDVYLFGSCCLFHDCLTGCLPVLTVVSVGDRVEIYLQYCT